MKLYLYWSTCRIASKGSRRTRSTLEKESHSQSRSRTRSLVRISKAHALEGNPVSLLNLGLLP